jgi:Yip1 domain
MTLGTDETQPPPAVPAAPPEINPFQRIAGVLFTPVRTFAEIARRPDILVPLVLIVVIGFASMFAIVPRIDEDALIEAQIAEAKKRNPSMKAEDLEGSRKMITAFTKAAFYVQPFLAIAWYAIVAGVLLLGVRLFGGEGEYGQAFSVTLYSWIPYVILGIIMTIVIIAKGSFDVALAQSIVPSNAAFLVNMKEQPVLYSLLSILDIFTFWTLALLIIGFSAVSKLSKGKTAAIVISLWLVLSVIRVGIAAMSAAKG